MSDMWLTHNLKGISRTIWVLLLLISFILGALFSYVYTIGYYAPSEFRIPERSYVAIQDVEFSKQDTHFFNVTVLNPFYSPSDVNITRIEARTTDDNLVHVITDTSPPIPFLLQKGNLQTFRATWNWANYTGIRLPYTDRPVEIRVFLEDGTGAILELKRPLTRLIMTEIAFNQSININHFNVTVQNLESSETYVNITAFIIEGNKVSADKVIPQLPYTLNPGDTPVEFQCFYNWTDLMGQSVLIGVDTYEGYIATATVSLPEPVTLEISQVIFNATISTERFNITVTNHANSSTYVDIDRITLAVGQEAAVNVTQSIPNLPLRLDSNESALIDCTWTWSTYSGQLATITVYTSQGFIVSKETQIP
jgi:hypothetical protein